MSLTARNSEFDQRSVRFIPLFFYKLHKSSHHPSKQHSSTPFSNMNCDDGRGKLDAVIARRSRLENLAKGRIHNCINSMQITPTYREDKVSRLDAIKTDVLQQIDRGYLRVLQPTRAVQSNATQDIVDLYLTSAAAHGGGDQPQRTTALALAAPPQQLPTTTKQDDILARWRQQRAKTALRASVLQQPAHPTASHRTTPCTVSNHAATQTDAQSPCCSTSSTQTKQPPACTHHCATQTMQPSTRSIGCDALPPPHTPPHTSPPADVTPVQQTWLHDAELSAQAAAFAVHMVVHMAGLHAQMGVDTKEGVAGCCVPGNGVSARDRVQGHADDATDGCVDFFCICGNGCTMHVQ